MEENQRVRLSKMMLKNGLIELLSRESIHKISVTEICNVSHVNRTTFYKHYGSQYDLFQDIENDVLASIISHVNKYDNSMDGTLKQLLEIVTYIDKNIDTCRIVFDYNIDPDFPQKLLTMPNIEQMIAKLDQGYDKDELEYIFCVVVEGSFNMIRKWMSKEGREPAENIAGILGNIVIKLLHEPMQSVTGSS
ncbi:MAG: TetR/AcrR family transcriptional regulator [Clostridiales Family XIII bacterium]|jgi:AcrR family transcriptional regulator|nr:TetR/AcrR family transcriptional regulator [Clostridiales Family XIII bacterium]